MDHAFLPFRKYAQFRGRSRRAEFWQYLRLVVITHVLTRIAEIALGIGDPAAWAGPITLFWALFTLLPTITLAVRRLHDAGFSAWNLLMLWVPYLALWPLLVMMFWDSEHGVNKHGPSPKQAP